MGMLNLKWKRTRRMRIKYLEMKKQKLICLRYMSIQPLVAKKAVFTMKLLSEKPLILQKDQIIMELKLL